MTALAGRLVLELPSRYAAVGLAGAELAAAGAAVTLVEPPDGHPWRGRGPTVDGTGAFFAAMAAGKEPATADLADGEDLTALVRAAAAADVVLAGDDAPPALLEELSRVTLLGVISGWGASGAWAGRPASEATVQALSGYGAYLGERGGRPRRVGADIAEHSASRLLVHGVLSGLFVGRRPESVTVSLLAAACALKTIMWAARTDPDVWAGFHLLAATNPPERGWRTRDGAVALDFLVGDEERWRALMRDWGVAEHFAGLPEGRWAQTAGVGDDAARYRDVYERATAQRTTAEVVHEVEEAGGLAAPYLRYENLLDHEQVAAEGVLADVHLEDRVLRRVRPVAQGALDMAQGASGSTARYVPGNADPPAVPISAGATLSAVPFAAAEVRGDEGTAEVGPVGDGAGPPLAGLRVVDLSQGAVGPWAGSLLARLGADIVKVDPPRGDFILAVGPRSQGRPTTYASLNVGKRCATLDARDPRQGRALAALAREADVLIENLRPGVMGRLGLGYDHVAAENPGIVYLSSTGYGQGGPLAARRCTDPQMQAFGGLAAANDPRTPESLRYYAVVDMATALAGAQLVLQALVERTRTGRGRWVTTSMLHAGLSLQARQVAEHLVAGGLWRPPIDGALRTLDGWVAVSAVDDDAFARFAAAIDRPEFAAELRFATEHARCANATALLAAVEDVTGGQPTTWWLRRLRRAGVPAAPYLDDEAAAEHHQLRATRAIESVPAGQPGPLEMSATPWTFSHSRLGPPGHAPLPGWADDQVNAAAGPGRWPT